MEEIEEQLDDEEIVEDEDADVEEADEAAADRGAGVAQGRGRRGRRVHRGADRQEGGAAAEEDEDDDAVLALTREERLEPVAEKVVPPQSSEFVCKNATW